jgi:hypothetical protein
MPTGGGGRDGQARPGRSLRRRCLRVERACRRPRSLRASGLHQRDEPPPSRKPEDADTVLFIDGLRMDVARRLAGLLDDKGAEVKLGWRWTGFPSVTATCKPLASPAASQLHGADTRSLRAGGQNEGGHSLRGRRPSRRSQSSLGRRPREIVQDDADAFRFREVDITELAHAGGCR